MYWVNRNVMRNVMRNPFNPTELITNNKANELFMEIYEEYKKDFPQTWAKSTIPLNYFLDKFVAMTGSDRKELEKGFLDYLNKNKVKDLTKEKKDK